MSNPTEDREDIVDQYCICGEPLIGDEEKEIGLCDDCQEGDII